MAIRVIEWTEEEAEAFWALADRRETGCWRWLGAGSNSRSGYGSYRHRKEAWEAHRLAYLFAHDIHEIASAVLICHHCDHPWCIRPDHLFLGDKAANSQDAAVKGRLGISLLGIRRAEHKANREAESVARRERLARDDNVNRALRELLTLMASESRRRAITSHRS